MQTKIVFKPKKLALRSNVCIEKNQYRQFSITDFNQPIGFKLDPENRWEKAVSILQKAIEERYAKLFLGKTGMPAKPFRMALGSLLIQKQLEFSDRELVEKINEMIIDFNNLDDPTPLDGGGSNSDGWFSSKSDNVGSMILDATCTQQNIKLLNEARENLENMVDFLCAGFGYYTWGMYRKDAR